MLIRIFKVHTPSTRNRSCCHFKLLTGQKPQKSLITNLFRANGKNNKGHKTIKHRGGGHKRRFRQIDFKLKQYAFPRQIITFEYDPNRSAFIALTKSSTGKKTYILKPAVNQIGDLVLTHSKAPILSGNSLPLKNIPIGTQIHNIEIHPGKGAQLVRAAGTSAQIVSKEYKLVGIKLPSGEIRTLLNQCWATIGQISNWQWNQIKLGKAGRKRWFNRRPRVRGSVMNAVDHPHGGGEGRSPIGQKHPRTPWGKPTLGQKTRKKVKYSNSFILKKRK